MLLKIGVALAAIPMALLAVVAGTGVAVVDVKDSGGTHIVVPVPLLVVETAARLAPDHHGTTEIRHGLDHARRWLPVAVEVLDALAEAPDAELVRVDEADQHVRVSKVGDMLAVRVEGAREDVSVKVPLRLAREAVRQAAGGRLSAGDLLAALRQARLTRIVDVRDGDDHVKVTIW